DLWHLIAFVNWGSRSPEKELVRAVVEGRGRPRFMKDILKLYAEKTGHRPEIASKFFLFMLLDQIYWSLRDEEEVFALEKSMPFRLLAAFSEMEAEFNSFIGYMRD
ncbi:MAG: hypothetical protein FJ088_16900, partial [Deltaproteobacteria bacterium]|nr:hypothetical protein [Deltaproteobacteria bacterium]